MKSRTRLLAFAAVIVFFALIWLYVREFAWFSNTMGVQWLILSGVGVGTAIGAAVLYRFRDRFSPWQKHVPEYLFILVFSILFCPLFISLLNRSLGTSAVESFEFVQETPFYASNYGVLKGEKISPTGYRLYVRRNGRDYMFQYRKQPYYPITKPGEEVLLPVRKGLFGFRVVELI